MKDIKRIKKALFIGDIVDEQGKNAVTRFLPEVIKKYSPNIIIANGENIADGGRGITDNDIQFLFSKGIDVITLGNHALKKSVNLQQYSKRVIRPANFPKETIGNGYTIIEKDNLKFAVINMLGNVDMPMPANHAFTTFDSCIKEIKNANFIFVDYHAQSIGEKQSFAHYVNGRATAVIGTHTHTPTNDCQVLNKGTAYQTDAGMCGCYIGIRGKHTFRTMNKFIYWDDQINKNQIYVNNNEVTLCGCIIYFDPISAKATSIKPIIYGHYLYGAIV